MQSMSSEGLLMRKKYFVILLFLVFISILLSGCHNNSIYRKNMQNNNDPVEATPSDASSGPEIIIVSCPVLLRKGM
jgi:hypothetical protein